MAPNPFAEPSENDLSFLNNDALKKIKEKYLRDSMNFVGDSINLTNSQMLESHNKSLLSSQALSKISEEQDIPVAVHP